MPCNFLISLYSLGLSFVHINTQRLIQKLLLLWIIKAWLRVADQTNIVAATLFNACVKAEYNFFSFHVRPRRKQYHQLFIAESKTFSSLYLQFIIRSYELRLFCSNDNSNIFIISIYRA